MLLVPIICSCLAQKKYTAPELQQVQTSAYRLASPSEDSTNMADVSWRKFFQDTLLQKHIQLALDSNFDVRIALQNIARAAAFQKQGKAGYFPTANITPSVTRVGTSKEVPFGGIYGTRYQVEGKLSWEADIWGKLNSQDKAFRAAYMQSVELHQAVVTQLVAQVASTYFQLMTLDEQLRLTNENIENRSKSVRVITALKEAGSVGVTAVAVLQLEAQLFDAKETKSQLEGQIKILENEFCTLLGTPAHRVARGNIDAQQFETPFAVGIPVDLLQHRPDLRAAEQRVINAFELQNVAKANMLPKFTITASGGTLSEQLGNLMRPEALFFNLMGGVTAPIFNGRQLKTQYEAASAEEKKALLDYEKSVMNAGREVNDALINLKVSQERIDLKHQSVVAYQDAVRKSNLLLESGMINYLELLNAQRSELVAALSEARLKNIKYGAMINLYRAVGGGVR